MNKLGLLPGECIVVEDSVQIKAGKTLPGCQVIALEGSLEKALLCDADYIISCLSDMQKIV